MKLNDITQYIQDICQNISNVLDVDVTVVSKDLYRIAGTGIFKDKIGDKICLFKCFKNRKCACYKQRYRAKLQNMF